MDLRLQLISDPDALDGIHGRWRELWMSSPGASPFQSPAWCRAWLRQFATSSDHVHLAIWGGSELVGFAPFSIWCSSTGERISHFAGSGLADINEALYAPGFEKQVAELIWDFLLNGPRVWDRLELDQLADDSPLIRHMPGHLPGMERRIEEGAPCLILDLSRARSLDEAVKGSLADQVSYLRRRALRDLGAEIRDLPSVRFGEALAALIELHGRRWRSRGLPGVLADPVVQRFHRDLVRELSVSGEVRFLGLESPRRGLLGVLYGFRHREREYYYLSGFDPELARYSPGTLLVGAAIESAITRGTREFDFLRGREPYKYRWGACERQFLRLEERRIA